MPPSGVVRATMEEANRRFKNFRGHSADYLDAHDLPDNKYYWEIGQLDGVLYTTKRDGIVEHYRHDFKAGCRPILAASADGKELRIIGGKFEVTELGIVDKPKQRR